MVKKLHSNRKGFAPILIAVILGIALLLFAGFGLFAWAVGLSMIQVVGLTIVIGSIVALIKLPAVWKGLLFFFLIGLAMFLYPMIMEAFL